MTDPPVIVIDRVSKWYRQRDRRPSLVDTLYRIAIGARRPPTGFWSLRDVSLEVARGESVGLIGHNGAGKSTLLKIIAGITHPTAGRVHVRSARISTHLGFGSGFNRLLTGRENVFLQGTILGLTNREVRERLDPIIELSGLGRAVDQPMWTYSSGMVGRLAVAVAAHAQFDLLLLDEALSAGDLSFRERSRRILTELREARKTMVIVSHALDELHRLCDRGLWLDHGTVVASGPIDEVLEAYRAAGGQHPLPVGAAAGGSP